MKRALGQVDQDGSKTPQEWRTALSAAAASPGFPRAVLPVAASPRLGTVGRQNQVSPCANLPRRQNGEGGCEIAWEEEGREKEGQETKLEQSFCKAHAPWLGFLLYSHGHVLLKLGSYTFTPYQYIFGLAH